MTESQIPTFDYNNITQLTQEQAITCNRERHWIAWNFKVRALFQVHQDRLCMPISVYLEALTKTLGRPVFSHEIVMDRPRLKAELLGLIDAPTLNEIIALLPQDAVILVIN